MYERHETSLVSYLDDSNLFEEVCNLLNCRILPQSLYKNGVVVRVIRLTSCGQTSGGKKFTILTIVYIVIIKMKLVSLGSSLEL